MSIVREAMSDEGGQGDMAYIAIGLLTVAAVLSLAFIFSMSAVSYHKCEPITTVSKGDQSTTSVIPCNFDPLPVGQAAGLIFGAFAALIGSLAGYMAATRKQSQRMQTINTTGATVVSQVQPPAPAEAATDVENVKIRPAKGKR